MFATQMYTYNNRASTTKKRYGLMSLLIGLLLLFPTVQAQEISTLDDITFTSLPGDSMQINLSFSGPVSQPTSFNVDEPPRIALDFTNVKSNLSWRSRRVATGSVKTISAIEAGARTRIVINLTKQSPYSVKQQGNQIVVVLGGQQTVSTPMPAAPTPQATPMASATDVTGESSSTNPVAPAPSFAPAASTPAVPSIQTIDFRRGDAGEGRIFVTFSNPNIVVDVRQEGGKIVVDFMNTELPENLHQRLDVMDFATPVNTIDTFKDANNTRMLITPVGEYEHLAYQSDNTLTIDVKPVAIAKDAERRKTEYKGEKLSLNFQDIEVRAVLQLLADFSGLNVVVSDSVQGNITLRLKNTPWDQALDIILKTKGLAMRQNGNVILVAPGEEIAQRERLELESQKQITELAPLRSEVIQVNYAKATEFAALIKSDKNSLLSERGNISVDERTNSLLVRDTVEHIDEIRSLVTSLDIPIRQVLIEARIVSASEDFARDLGVNMSSQPGQRSAGANLDQNFVANMPTAANLTAAGTTSLSVGILDNIGELLNVELRALETEGKGEVISSPRVVTSNQRKAVIQDGREIPFSTTSGNAGTNTTFRQAVMGLEVTPQITPDDRIILDIKVTKDKPNYDSQSGQYTIEKKQVETQVLINNGETIVLGGIYETVSETDYSKVPFLGDIPLLGTLFRTKTKSNLKTELLIFVTPKILKDQFRLN